MTEHTSLTFVGGFILSIRKFNLELRFTEFLKILSQDVQGVAQVSH